MRDQTIFDAFHRFEDAVKHDVGNLTKQNVLNRSRIFAFEKVLFGSRWFFIKAIFMALICPRKLKERFDLAHAKEVAEFNDYMAKRKDSNGNGDIRII